MKNFGDIKNIRRFAVSKHFRRGERTRQILTGIFYALLIYGFVTPCGALMRPQPLLGVGQRDMQNRFLFSANTNSFEMSKLEEKNLQGVKYSNPSATTDSKSLKKLVRELDKQISALQNENDYLRYYIASRGMPTCFSYFEKTHPIDSQDWKKLYKMQCQLNNI